MDYSKLTPATVDADEVRGTRTRTPRVLTTPFVDWLRQCNTTGSGMKIELPNVEAVNEARALIRQAAQYLNIGCRTAVTENEDGTMQLSFKAAERRNYKARESEDSGELDEPMPATNKRSK